MKTYVKDPDALLDYPVDWQDPDAEGGPYLEDGETITTSTFEVVSGDVEISGTPTNDNTTTKVWLEAGTVGTTSIVKNQITTSLGRRDDRSFIVRIEQR